MKKTLAALLLSSLALAASAETVGTVSTTFKLLSPNDKVVVDVFDDPVVNGVACYLSHAKTGGYAGALGLAEDTSDASVACRQVGPISFKEKIDRELRTALLSHDAEWEVDTVVDIRLLRRCDAWAIQRLVGSRPLNVEPWFADFAF